MINFLPGSVADIVSICEECLCEQVSEEVWRKTPQQILSSWNKSYLVHPKILYLLIFDCIEGHLIGLSLRTGLFEQDKGCLTYLTSTWWTSSWLGAWSLEKRYLLRDGCADIFRKNISFGDFVWSNAQSKIKPKKSKFLTAHQPIVVQVQDKVLRKEEYKDKISYSSTW